MFKNIIFKTIQGIKNLYERLDNAYQQTYTDKTVSEAVNSEIDKRKKNNRDITLEKIAMALRHQYFEDTKDFMPYDVSKELAKEFYAVAKIKGDVDEMNNWVGEEKNGKGKND